MRSKSPKTIVSRPRPNKNQQTGQPGRQQPPAQQRLNQLKRERRKLKAAEHTAQKPLKNHLKRKGEMVGRRIGHLQHKQQDR